jgi:hypothetical protein
VSEKKKFDGAVVSVADVEIGDKHGCLQMIARDS